MTPKAGGVTASSAAAAESGAQILRKGGNAVDAAVATALASCVADPGNTGIAGYGGHMIVAPVDGEPVCIDFNMWLPAHWSPASYRRAYPNCNPLVSAVPNVVAGLALALERYGSIGWSEVLEPAVELAASGVEANGTTSQAFKEVEGSPFVKACFSFTLSDHPTTEVGFRFRQPALAETLEKLSRHGPEWFYDGPIGRAACEILEKAGSPVTPREWADAPKAATVASASKLDFAPATLFSAPLGTSGAASMFATVAAGEAVAQAGDLESPEAILSWAQALASMWSYRFGTPSGNDFRKITAARWTEQALRFKPAKTIPEGTGHTCHLNTCDGTGMLVAVTLTHGQFLFGGRWVVPNTGVIMNAGMHLLTAADPIASNGRFYAVTNMNPTVALLRNEASIAIGCPGARRIPTAVGLVLARHLFGGLPLQEAVSRGRFHAETSSLATIEKDRWSVATVEALRSEFGNVENEEPRGPLTAIRRDTDGSLSFGLDDRVSQGFAAMA